MNRLLAFPITPDILTLLRYKDQMSGYTIRAVSSFKEDFALLEKCRALGVETADNPNNVKCWDSLLLDHSFPQAKTLTKYTQLIEHARTKGKSVIVTPSLAQSLKTDINEPQTQELYQDGGIVMSDKETKKRFIIPVPVVSIFGTGGYCSKFETQLLVKRVFEQEGYKVLGLSANPLAPLCGMYSLPKFLAANSFSWENKIVKFNHFVSALCENEKPDVVVLGIPSGIVPLSDWDTNYFTELPLILTTALSIDIGVLSFYSMALSNDYIKEMINLCCYKFDTPIRLMIMSRQAIDIRIDEKNTKYLFLNDELYRRLLSSTDESQIPIIGLDDNKATEAAILQLIRRLESNCPIV